MKRLHLGLKGIVEDHLFESMANSTYSERHANFLQSTHKRPLPDTDAGRPENNGSVVRALGKMLQMRLGREGRGTDQGTW